MPPAKRSGVAFSQALKLGRHCRQLYYDLKLHGRLRVEPELRH